MNIENLPLDLNEMMTKLIWASLSGQKSLCYQNYKDFNCLYEYQVVNMNVPRRSGKTHALLKIAENFEENFIFLVGSRERKKYICSTDIARRINNFDKKIFTYSTRNKSSYGLEDIFGLNMKVNVVLLDEIPVTRENIYNIHSLVAPILSNDFFVYAGLSTL